MPTIDWQQRAIDYCAQINKLEGIVTSWRTKAEKLRDISNHREKMVKELQHDVDVSYKEIKDLKATAEYTARMYQNQLVTKQSEIGRLMAENDKLKAQLLDLEVNKLSVGTYKYLHDQVCQTNSYLRDPSLQFHTGDDFDGNPINQSTWAWP